jgi:ethanolamine utilization protein EutN
MGTVTLSRAVAELAGARFVIVVPEDAAALRGEAEASAESLVGFDSTQAGIGDRVALSEGREAAQPFHPRAVPIDAYCAAILDEVSM